MKIKQISYIENDKSLTRASMYSGPLVETMPKLLVQGYTPISISEIVEQKIKAWIRGDRKLINFWSQNYFTSGDSVMYHSDGRIKIVRNSQTLKNVNQKSILDNDGSLILPEGTFENTNGFEFSKKEVLKYGNKYLKKEKILESPIWIALLGNNKELLRQYTQYVFLKSNHSYVMRIEFTTKNPKFEIETPIFLFPIKKNCAIYCYYLNLVDDCEGINNLIGLSKSQIPTSSNITLEKLIRDIKQARQNGLLTPAFEELISKYEI